MFNHFSILVCRIPRTEKPGGLQSMELQRVGHNRVINMGKETEGWYSPYSLSLGLFFSDLA